MRSPFLARLHALAASDRLAVEDDVARRSFAELYDRALRARAALCDGRASLEVWGDRVVAVIVPASGREAECATLPGPLNAT